MKRQLRALVLALCWLPAMARAGAGPLNTLVVVNGASRDSRALGMYYLERHGIPETHLCTLKTDPRSPSINQRLFEREIRFTNNNTVLRNDKDANGALFGIGAEYALSDNVAIRAEYDRTNFKEDRKRDRLMVSAAYRF